MHAEDCQSFPDLVSAEQAGLVKLGLRVLELLLQPLRLLELDVVLHLEDLLLTAQVVVELAKALGCGIGD